jgi:hypothetical protein
VRVRRGVQQAFTRILLWFWGELGVDLMRLEWLREAAAVDGSCENGYSLGLAWRWFLSFYMIAAPVLLPPRTRP